MVKIDLKKELKHLYNPSAREINLVDVPTMNFAMVDTMRKMNEFHHS